MTPHHKLHDLLTRLGAVPEGIEYHPSGAQWTIEGWKLASESTVLGLLRDAARRVLDDEMVEVSWDVISEGKITHWCVEHRPCNGYELIAENCESYESALIAGLEWVFEQQSSPESHPDHPAK